MGRIGRLLAVSAVLVSACSADSDPRPTPNPNQIRVGVSDLGSIDPVLAAAVDAPIDSAMVSRQVYEGLISYDPRTLEPVAALASAWSSDPDSRTWSFQIRKRVRFHSGKPLTASDVVYSLNRLAQAACAPSEQPEAGAPAYLMSLVVGYADVAQGCNGQGLSGIQVLGSDTVSIALQEPFADFPLVLGSVSAAIVPDGHTSRDPADGTGPYKVKSPWNGRESTLQRNDNYWGRRPDIPNVRFIGFPSVGQAYSRMLAGDLEISGVPSSKYRDAVRRLPEAGFVPTASLTYLGFNLASGRVASLPVRKAVLRAVDREALSEGVFDGTRDVVERVVTAPLELSGECPDCSRDLDASRELIASLGGNAPSQLTLGVAEEGSGPAIANAIARSLGEAGIAVRVVTRPLVDHVKGIQQRDTDMFVSGWVPAYPAADGLLVPLFRGGAPDNLTGYQNPETDTLLAAARKLKDPNARARAFAVAENRILADVAVVPLVSARTLYAFDPTITASHDILVDGAGMIEIDRYAYGG